MPQWININDRSPDVKGKYFVKIFKRKEIMESDRLEQYYGIFDKDVFWLDENNDAPTKTIIIENKTLSNDSNTPVPKIYNFYSLDNLQRLFGVKKGKSLHNKINL
jgi:hypothetical protein